MTTQTWPTAQHIRRQHLGNGPADNAACVAINADVAAFLAVHDTEEPNRTWWTAQLENGKVCGIWAETELEARLELEIWRGHPVAWITPDPACIIHERYSRSVLVKHRYDALFEVTPAPAVIPRAVNVPQLQPQHPTLFDLIGA